MSLLSWQLVSTTAWQPYACAHAHAEHTPWAGLSCMRPFAQSIAALRGHNTWPCANYFVLQLAVLHACLHACNMGSACWQACSPWSYACAARPPPSQLRRQRCAGCTCMLQSSRADAGVQPARLLGAEVLQASCCGGLLAALSSCRCPSTACFRLRRATWDEAIH